MMDQAEKLIAEAEETQRRFREVLARVGLDEATVKEAAARMRAKVPAALLARAEAELRARLAAMAPTRTRPGTSTVAIPMGIRA